MKHYPIFISIGLLVLLLSNSFQEGPNQASSDPREALAKQYCSTCHVYPDPQILTKRSWNYLLTDMGARLGIVDYGPIENIHPVALLHMTTREKLLRQAGLIPSKGLLPLDEWEAIREYYVEKAPKNPLPQIKKPKIKAELNQFDLVEPHFQPKGAIFTLNRIDQESGGLMLANIKNKTLTVLDQNLKIATIYPEREILVDASTDGEDLILLAIGDLMGSYIGVGKGSLTIKGKSDYSRPDPIIRGLHRPVSYEFSDLDLDGNEEIIICNFGDATGNVSIYDHSGIKIKEIISTPGAVRSQVHDFNQDGMPDIAVLMGDARENISIFYNQGDHHYQQQEVVAFHSAYGHTYFELQDFNNDGHMDLLAANGDTDADPFNTLKNYHGVRIYLNDGANNFELAFFYPMYGAHFAKASDFDQDGDLDIAASAFFPDFSSDKPEQFVFLENTGNLSFEAYTHPATFEGRWMTLDVGDYDRDGDADIVLGGGYHSLGMMIDHAEKFKSLLEDGKALLVFRNNLK